MIGQPTDGSFSTFASVSVAAVVVARMRGQQQTVRSLQSRLLSVAVVVVVVGSDALQTYRRGGRPRHQARSLSHYCCRTPPKWALTCAPTFVRRKAGTKWFENRNEQAPTFCPLGSCQPKAAIAKPRPRERQSTVNSRPHTWKRGRRMQTMAPRAARERARS